MADENVRAMQPICVYTATNRMEADMIIEVLENNDIHAYRTEDGANQAISTIAGGVNAMGTDIMVDREQAMDALDLIRETFGVQDKQTAMDEEDQRVAKTRRRNRRITRIIAWVCIGSVMLAVLFGVLYNMF